MPGPVPAPDRGSLGAPGWPQSQTLGTSLEMGTSSGQARMWAQLSGAHGRAGLWGDGDWLCCGITGVGTDGPRVPIWGPGVRAGWERPRRDQGQSGLMMPLGKQYDLNLYEKKIYN